jgi:hypothetical protein
MMPSTTRAQTVTTTNRVFMCWIVGRDQGERNSSRSRQFAVHVLIRHAGEAREPTTQHHAKLAREERMAALAQNVHCGDVALAPLRAFEMAANNGVASAIHGIARRNGGENPGKRIDSAGQSVYARARATPQTCV